MEWVSMAEPLHPSLTSPDAMQSTECSGVKSRHWTLEFSEVTNQASTSGISKDESGFGGCQETGSCLAATMWEQFGDGPFLFQEGCTPVHKARSIKTWMSEFGVGLHKPDLNPIEHLWDKLEQRLSNISV